MLVLVLWSLHVPLRTTAEAEQKSAASVCHLNIKQVGHSTNITTSEDQFECPNETELGTWVLPIFFISLCSTSFKVLVLMTEHFHVYLIFLFLFSYL